MNSMNSTPSGDGTVVALLDHREVLVEIPNSELAFVGNQFAIVGYQEIDLPGGRKHLNRYTKAVVKIVRLEGEGDEFAVCRTFRTFTTGLGEITSGQRTETLKIKPGSSVRAELNDEDLEVVVGDPVFEYSGESD